MSCRLPILNDPPRVLPVLSNQELLAPSLPFMLKEPIITTASQPQYSDQPQQQRQQHPGQQYLPPQPGQQIRPLHRTATTGPQHVTSVAGPQHTESSAGPLRGAFTAGPQYTELLAEPQHVASTTDRRIPVPSSQISNPESIGLAYFTGSALSAKEGMAMVYTLQLLLVLSISSIFFVIFTG
jgi:hypothetical protein